MKSSYQTPELTLFLLDADIITESQPFADDIEDWGILH